MIKRLKAGTKKYKNILVVQPTSTHREVNTYFHALDFVASLVEELFKNCNNRNIYGTVVLKNSWPIRVQFMVIRVKKQEEKKPLRR